MQHLVHKLPLQATSYMLPTIVDTTSFEIRNVSMRLKTL